MFFSICNKNQVWLQCVYVLNGDACICQETTWNKLIMNIWNCYFNDTCASLTTGMQWKNKQSGPQYAVYSPIKKDFGADASWGPLLASAMNPRCSDAFNGPLYDSHSSGAVSPSASRRTAPLRRCSSFRLDKQHTVHSSARRWPVGFPVNQAHQQTEAGSSCRSQQLSGAFNVTGHQRKRLHCEIGEARHRGSTEDLHPQRE